jgi:hypothetical protein
MLYVLPRMNLIVDDHGRSIEIGNKSGDNITKLRYLKLHRTSLVLYINSR